MKKVIATKAYRPLLGLSLAAALGALLTLLPWPGASSPNLWGYSSLCTFAPAATLFCAAIAGISCVVRASLNQKSPDFRGWLLRHAAGLALVLALLGLGAWATSSWLAEEAGFRALIAAPPASSAGALATPDGTFVGRAASGGIDAAVETTLAGGKIASVRLLEGRNIPANVEKEIIARLAGRSDTAVDAVSGATASSDVLIAAVADSLLRGAASLKGGK